MDIITGQGYDLEALKKMDKALFIKWYKREMFGNSEEALYNYEVLQGRKNNMGEIRLSELSNSIVLASEENFEFEGLCGTEDGILWEDSLEQFFSEHSIDVVDFVEDEIITLMQDHEVVSFALFEGKEGSSFPAQHVDFDCRLVGGAYNWHGMKKLTKEQAGSRFMAGQSVYLLYDDNSESLARNIVDIVEHDGEFGIEKEQTHNIFVAKEPEEQWIINQLQGHEGHELGTEIFQREVIVFCKDCQDVLLNFYREEY